MDILDETALNIYTDGSSLSNPRKGGVGVRFVFVNNDGNEEYSSLNIRGYSGATIGEMELQACICALETCMSKRPTVDISKYRKVIIHTDSLYVKDNYYHALNDWPKNQWRNRYDAPIQNAELWKKLTKIILKLYRQSRIRVEFVWVKAHKSSTHNKAVDRLAKYSARNAQKKSLSVSKVRKKISSKKTDLGSVVPEGQRLTVRLIQDKYLPLQKCYWYRYEVMSKKSKYYQNVDTATSKHLMKAGHTYFIRLNSDCKNPCIETVFHEVILSKPKGHPIS